MTVEQALRQNIRQLEQTGNATARLDCLVLFEDVLNISRAHLLARPEIILTAQQQKVLSQLVKRRAAHEPLAYIRRKAEFYGRTFYVDEHVLVPRPETEAIIDVLLKLPRHASIVDVGTGSGALAITAALELSSATVVGVDIDVGCIQVAKRNARSHNIPVLFLEGDLLAPVIDRRLLPDVLLCNLPYVPADYPINASASYEPRLALYGGNDGLDLYRKLFSAVVSTSQRTQYILTESLPEQHDALQIIAQHVGYTLALTQDFVQLFQRA